MLGLPPVMTLELERWLTEYIVGVYHAKRHRGIGTSPLQRWTTGAFGDAHDGGSSVIDRPANEDRIRLDFLPFVERTVQAYGISIDGIHYYSDVLRRFVGATENGPNEQTQEIEGSQIVGASLLCAYTKGISHSPKAKLT
jgi:hypothetical protein